MTGGLIQLVAYGVEDIYLTHDPQITYFKIVYRRHTNFSIESVPQFFNTKPDFGKKVTCTIGKSGDLIGKIYVAVKMPDVPQFIKNGEINKWHYFAWVKKLGYKLIKNIQVEIGGRIIDTHYGDWLNIWNELSLPQGKNVRKSIDRIVGHIPELYNFSNGKDGKQLYIPLQFWFCRNNGLALPLIALANNDVKIHVEFNDLKNCCVLGPTHSITLQEDIVHLKQFEYLEQNTLFGNASGLFIDYDIVKKKLYYIQVENKFQIPTTDNKNSSDFTITGKTSGMEVHPQINSKIVAINVAMPNNLNLLDVKLMVDYVYLDNQERLKFYQHKHEYLIETLQTTSEKTLTSNNIQETINFNHPCKLMAWRANFNYLANSYHRDSFNYTNSYQYDKKNDKYLGESVIKTSEILLNTFNRTEKRTFQYYTHYQAYNHLSRSPQEGIQTYSFGLKPENSQPSGTCNFSKIDNIILRIILDKKVTHLSPAKFRVYAITYNVLRIIHGIAGLAFAN